MTGHQSNALGFHLSGFSAKREVILPGSPFIRFVINDMRDTAEKLLAPTYACLGYFFPNPPAFFAVSCAIRPNSSPHWQRSLVITFRVILNLNLIT